MCHEIKSRKVKAKTRSSFELSSISSWAFMVTRAVVAGAVNLSLWFVVTFRFGLLWGYSKFS
jgi:hypothetical protein